MNEVETAGADSGRTIVLVQPPFVQLNAPYPSIYYLRSFLEKRGYHVLVRDHSIGLFSRIFCRAGLEKIFHDARTQTARAQADYSQIDCRPRKTPNYQSNYNYQIDRFLSEEKNWLSSIDHLIAFLRGQNREWGHFLALANGAIPGGPRFDTCLESFGGEVSPETAPLLASKLLADLADFISAALDPGFALIKYENAPFAKFQKDKNNSIPETGYILENFYKPYLEEEWQTLITDRTAATPLLIGITVPFYGCLTGAMACAESAKKYFGKKTIIAAGGGYVNTELRFTENESLFDYFDYLSFDRGYGSLDAILKKIDKINDKKTNISDDDAPLYKTIYRSAKNNAIIRSETIHDETNVPGETSAAHEANVLNEANANGREIDRQSVKTIFPDYSGVDFSRYICPVDDTNPMHRLWSDGRWLKAYLAHGCYWHSCAFCDVSLDYIKCYEPVDVETLFNHLLDQAEKTGIRGIHLVDEACPPQSLLQFAELNRSAGLPLVFWGNIRFEKEFTTDAAAVLAAGGLLGISAGIEVASEEGFKRTGKGISLREVVNACAAFKESGILTHAYLIYGYWDEDDQELVDSAETLRQLFSAGLLDSAFWHKFVLTRHSRIYAEHKRGLHKELKITLPLDSGRVTDTGEVTDSGDLSFDGEEKFDRYTAPLDVLLSAWMQGDTEEPVSPAFPFNVPAPSVKADLVIDLLDQYARKRDKERETIPENSKQLLFLGSRPIIKKTGKTVSLYWRWHLEDCQLKTETEKEAVEIAALLEKASCGKGLKAAVFYDNLNQATGKTKVQTNNETEKIFKILRKSGLTVIS